MKEQLAEQKVAVTAVLAMLEKRDLQPSAAEWETMAELASLSDPFVEAIEVWTPT